MKVFGDRALHFLAIPAAVAVMCVGCGGPAPVDKGAPGSPDAIRSGSITLGAEASYNGTMVEADEMPYDYEFGVDFLYDLKLDQATHLTIDDSPNYDCDFATTLLGPSYFLFLEDGSKLAFNYENRSAYSYVPGTSQYNYPDLVPAGAHRLVVRYFANGECRMNGSVKVSNRFAPTANSNFVTDYYLIGDWKLETKTVKYSSAGTFSMVDGENSMTGKVYNFPSEKVRKNVLAIETVVGTFAETYAVGQHLYCSYEIASAATNTLRVKCSQPNVTTFPADFDGAEEFVD